MSKFKVSDVVFNRWYGPLTVDGTAVNNLWRNGEPSYWCVTKQGSVELLQESELELYRPARVEAPAAD